MKLNRPAALSFVVGVALIAIACGPDQPRSGNAVPSIRSAGGDQSPIATGVLHPSLDPAWLEADAVTCDRDLWFSPRILGEPGFEETGVDLPGRALKAYLVGPRPGELADLPTTGWHRVAQTATRVEFVGVEVERSRLWFVSVVNSGGQWQPDSSGECAGFVRRADGFAPADWWVDLRQVRPSALDKDIRALVEENACTGGKSPEGRLAPPIMRYLDDAVVVTMSIRALRGAHDCIGNQPYPLTIRLEQALGDRRLLDGGSFPPRDATESPH